eukprot:scaffold11434_cov115-Skeletonema_marinoi.AAC.2
MANSSLSLSLLPPLKHLCNSRLLPLLVIRLQLQLRPIHHHPRHFPQPRLWPLESQLFNDTCTLSTGARCCIAAIVFWFLAALASCQATSVEERKGVNNDGGGENLREPLVPDNLL